MTLFVWGGFLALVLALLALDLGVFHRKPHEPSTAEALAWSALWIALAFVFNGAVYFLYENNVIGGGLAFPEDVAGKEAALAFFTGYLLEKSLSLDNIFVIALIFSYFRIPLRYQHRVLFWGVLGAMVMRGLMIWAGAALIGLFYWMNYVFGALLFLTAARMLAVRHDNLEPEKNPLIRLARRVYPVTDGLREERFFVRENGIRMATPMFLVLLLVESTDLLFAVDSIPAIFAVTSDPFIVYTSNVFAILGLRSLYFALAPLLTHFRFLRASLVFILAFVGIKIILAHHYPIPIVISLSVIGGVLLVGVLSSVVVPEVDTAPLRSPVEDDLHRLVRMTKTVAVRTAVLLAGGVVSMLGAALFFVPPLGSAVYLAGLALLASQFFWARRLLVRARRRLS